MRTLKSLFIGVLLNKMGSISANNERRS